MGEGSTLAGVRTLRQLLARLPDGQQALNLAQRTGIWSNGMHDDVKPSNRVFPSDFSVLQGDRLSEEFGYWQSEAFRATELCGLLEGQRVNLIADLKACRAASRSRLRRHYRTIAEQAEEKNGTKIKPPATAQLNDETDEEPAVRDLESTIGMLMAYLETAKARKEACLNGCAALSREISLRQAMMGSRL